MYSVFLSIILSLIIMPVIAMKKGKDEIKFSLPGISSFDRLPGIDSLGNNNLPSIKMLLNNNNNINNVNLNKPNNNNVNTKKSNNELALVHSLDGRLLTGKGYKNFDLKKNDEDNQSEWKKHVSELDLNDTNPGYDNNLKNLTSSDNNLKNLTSSIVQVCLTGPFEKANPKLYKNFRIIQTKPVSNKIVKQKKTKKFIATKNDTE